MVCEIIYHDHCVVIPDHRLVLLIRILIRCLDQIETSVPSAARWRNVWSRELGNRVFGMLDLELPEVLKGDDDVEAFKPLLQLAKEEIRSFGEEITPAQFEQVVQSKTLWLEKGIATSTLEDDIDRIASLISH